MDTGLQQTALMIFLKEKIPPVTMEKLMNYIKP